MSYLTRVRAELAAIEAAGRRRHALRALPVGALDFASNDYLGLSRDPRVVTALGSTAQVGSGGSRLLSGAHDAHANLEDRLAAWTERERALLFSSGYLAAIGAITALARCTEVAYSDELVHACLIDGLRLTKLERHIVPHGRVFERSGEGRAALVVTESAFGMDGSRAPLPALLGALRDGDVLLIDEAHALGVAGPHGSGYAAEFADPRVVILGTLSKALGAAGGFVAGPADVVELLTNVARPFIFDTAAPPAVVAAAAQALAIVRSSDGDTLRARVNERAAYVRAELRTLGYDVRGDDVPIVPVVLGSEAAALALARSLEAQGIFAPAIRPPTVPAGTSRLRLVLRADHSERDVERLVEALRAVTAAVR